MTINHKIKTLATSVAKGFFMVRDTISSLFDRYPLFPLTSILKDSRLSKTLIIGLMMLLGVESAYCAIRTASVSGNWSNTTTWGGAAVPTSGDDVAINAGVTLTMDVNSGYCNNLKINTNGYLTWSGSGTLNVAANFTNNGWSGLFTPGNGTVNFTGSTSAINGSATSQVFNNIIVSKTTGKTLSYGGSTTSITLNGDFTLTSGTFAPGANLIVTGNWNNNGGTFTPGTGTVTMNGIGKYIQGSVSTTFYNLTIGTGNNANILLGVDQTVNRTLTLSNGLLKLGAYNLVLGASSPAISGGSFYSTNMIVADGTGQVRKLFTSATSYVFPIGDSSSNYSPITLNFTSGAFAGGAYAGVNVTPVKHPQNTSITNYLSRYWTVRQSGISAFSCTVAGTYVGGDVVGRADLQAASEYTNSAWTTFSALSGNTLTANGVANFGDFTGVGFSTVTPSSSSLTGFNYIIGSGPSTQQQFTVSGTNLTDNITVTPPADYEISTNSGSGFQSSPITLIQSGGFVYTQTIYVRLKTGLAVGNYSENIVLSSFGSTSQNVSLSGSVTYCVSSGTTEYQTSITSVVFNTTNKTSAKPAGYNDYSAQSTDVVIGNSYPLTVKLNTAGRFTVYAYAWIDWNDDGTFSDTEKYDLGYAYRQSNGTTSIIPLITIPANAVVGKLRMRVSCEYNTYPGPCDTGFDGEVEDYTINVLPTITTGTITGSPFNTGDAVSIPFSTYGSFTAGNVFTAQLSNASGSFASPVTLGTLSAIGSGTINGIIPAGTLAGTGYRIRVVGSTPAVNGTDNGVNIIIIAGASITRSVIALSNFTYVVQKGPSAEQSFTLSASSLTAPLIVTPPSTNYEISTLSGGIFQNSALNLTPVSGQVSATIYVRLRSGLSIGSYGPQDITLSSTGFTSKTVSCTGMVIPGITVGGGGSYCAGGTISLTSSPNPANITLTNEYWTGPNGFYSALQNPTITNATPAMSGTYTVTGNYVPTGNLVKNGNFESGNTDFTTSYTLSSGGSSGLWNPGVYAVIAAPNSQHSNFCSCGDHTTGSGLQFVANGASIPQIIWKPTDLIVVTPNTNYQFTYWVQTVDQSDPNPSQTKLLINGVDAGPIYTASTTQGAWTQFAYNWNSRSSTTADLVLMSENTVGDGNDFAIDDIVFQRVYTSSASVDVSVLAYSASANVNIAASPGNSVNSGTSVTFTATPTSGGTAPVYQWQVNGVNVGANSPTYTYIPTDGNTVTCTMTSNSGCLAGSATVTSNTITMTVNTVVNYWIGTTSTDWSTPSNWTSGVVPGTGDNIVFSTAATKGDAVNNLVLDVDRTIGALINQSSKKLIIPPAKCLTVNGNIDTGADVNRIYIQAYPDGTQQNGSLIFYTTSPVYGTVEMYARGSYSAIGTSYGGTTYHYSWQYFGIPLTGLKANPTLSESYVRSWDETKDAANHWVSLSNASTLNPFYGYEITQASAKMIYFQGQLVNTDFNSGVLPLTSGAAYPGQYIFANPYTAAIDATKIDLGTDTDGSVYLYTTGSYAAWGNSGGGTSNASAAGQYQTVPKLTAGQNGVPAQIPSMQAFLIKLSQGSLSTSTVGLSYSAVVKNKELQRAKSLEDTSMSDMVSTRIDVSGSTYSDRMWLFSDSTCSKNFDRGLDGYKMLGSTLSPQLYAIEPDGEYQIDAVNNMNDTQLGFKPGVDVEYTFTFTHQNTNSRYAAIYLMDAVENKVVDVTANGSQYKFAVDATTTYKNRFRIITRYNEQSSQESSSKIKLFNANGKFFVENLSDEKGEFSLCDMAGRYIRKISFGANSVSEVGSVNQAGIYIGRAVISTEKVTERFIIAKE